MLLYSQHISQHSKQIARVLAIVFVLNIGVAAAKLIYGLMSGSISMQADGIHSTIDSFGNIVALVGIYLAGRPADTTHPYGHSKFEIFASLAIGCLLAIAAFEVGSGAVERLASGTYTATVTGVSFVVMIVTLAINIFVTVYERRAAKRLISDVLHADSLHTLSDVLTTIGVIIGLIFVEAGYPMADPIMALIVTLFIAISAISVFRSALKILSDHSQLSSMDIQKIAHDIPGILHVHAIRSRGTESEVYCDMHILVDPEMTVMSAHKTGNELEQKIKDAYPNVREVLVHIEPYCEEEMREQETC